MVKQFLITRPNYDKETSYVYSFSKAVVAIAKENKEIHVTELDGKNVTRKNFVAAVSANKPRLIFLNGHGDKMEIYGHNDEPILDKANVNLTSGKIVYALSCGSLIGLGNLAIKSGAEAYIGYEEEFTWVGEISKTAIPDKDKNASPFRKICFLLGKNLLSGMTVGESVTRTREEYKRLIKNYGTSEDYYGDAPLIGLALSWNLLFLGFQGKPNAVF